MPTAGYIKIIGSTSANMTEGSLSTASMGNKHVANHDSEMIVHEVKHVVTVPTDPLIRSTVRTANTQTVYCDFSTV